ncbi:von willebrand factor type A domain protein [Ichthyophthirius multifiliis]|uniref:von willebrand factor type A domain protein n=1 Tax=Ichthyophthirius multifiliis TaxID=5932 RepID=G0QKW1_ICHMU|nr:von willebrand factor type A domain protein [Ichthyophthirius multifiliis]EGR34145.1 von willebrand factor type A domain protein [Ichthyophthirius multifiliis]|eukprot:XP_004039449.1 von willebrand factor type A domain protein [Ichthyophthirius multifiliis]
MSNFQNYQSQNQDQYIFKENNSLNQCKYNDDDDIKKTDYKEIAKKQNTPEYDLEKGLSISVKTLQKHFQFNSKQEQQIPIMVSVKTLEQTMEQSEKQNIQNNSIENRPNIDLVCVIDNSGSMQGQKLENVKKALLFLLDFMKENDRLCLILFNSYGQRLCRLMTTNQQNKNEFQKIINQLFSNGGTDINSGMEIAFKVLKERKNQNPVSSIFLLSDGQDSSAEQKVQSSLQKHLPDEILTIHSFGFGSDHDPELMNKICAMKDGNFYYVEKIDQIDEFFVDALGGLFSVVAQDIKIDVNINIEDQNFNKYLKNCRVNKTYGDMWQCQKQNQNLTIKANQLISGVSKDYVFELTIPHQDVQKIEDFERNVELIKVQIQAIPINSEYTTSVVKNANLVLTLFTEFEKIAEDSEFHDDVEFNYLRVKAAEAMDLAIQEADLQRYDQGQLILQSMIKKIEFSCPQNKQKLQKIVEDLEECKIKAKPQVYEEIGKCQMMMKKNINYKQQSRAVEQMDINQNKLQQQMNYNIKIMKTAKK